MHRIALAALAVLHTVHSLPLGSLVFLNLNASLALSTCDFCGYFLPLKNNDDFLFWVVPAIDGSPLPAVSLEVRVRPGKYLGIPTNASSCGSPGHIGLAGGATRATWVSIPVGSTGSPLADSGLVRLMYNGSGPLAGSFLAAPPNNTGPCPNRPSVDATLTLGGETPAAVLSWSAQYPGPVPTPTPQPGPPPAILPAAMAVDASGPVTPIPRTVLGCHTGAQGEPTARASDRAIYLLKSHPARPTVLDPGYLSQPQGWSSDLLYGSSFEQGYPDVYAWNDVSSPTAVGTATLDRAVVMNIAAPPAPSLALNFSSGTGFLGWSNRGQGNEGLSLVAGAPYEGDVVVLAPAGGTLTVALRDRNLGVTLASAEYPLSASSHWQHIQFASLVPSGGTTCVGIKPLSDPTIDCGYLGVYPGHICVRCGGEFAVGLSAPGPAVHIGYASLHPGPWGRFGGLRMRRDVAETMMAMGVTAIRAGGSVGSSLLWKAWRGPQWARAAMQFMWGQVLAGPWGPFEAIDGANALGAVPTITLSDSQNASDWADLVEYCYGDANTTWGAVRVLNDSHPAVYRVTHFELGNEQVNPNFVEQVLAMEERRVAVGAPPLNYLYPLNTGVNASTAAALIAAGVDPARIVTDCHSGSGGGIACIESAASFSPPFNMSGANDEINAESTTIRRAIGEAADLQAWLNASSATLARTHGRHASFCLERSGHYDDSQWDQGLSFFLPNMTWLTPPGQAHAMLVSQWLGNAIPASATVPQWWFAGSAQAAADGSSVLVQLVNSAWGEGGAATVQLSLSGFAPAPQADVWTLANPPGVYDVYAGNTPSEPLFVAPVQSSLLWPAGAAAMNVTLPPLSYTLVKLYAL